MSKTRGVYLADVDQAAAARLLVGEVNCSSVQLRGCAPLGTQKMIV